MSDQRYLVTARKYRPTLFKELVAQEHVTETLKNALRLDRLAHAYLFSGPRGVGKTTAARILAKAINCTTPPEERTDATEPCRTCDSCRSFEEGRSLNIFEIDAASNRKVEDMQAILDKVRVPPQGSRKKVYIIDEVHMMSTHAFNALLKTLEEPPPHLLFIFATTEPHKVLPTILSRCQRFDFRRIPVPDVVAHLRAICRAESITADEASLMLVARKGDGALRDALSAFDQAVSLCGTDLRYADLARALRVVEVDLFFEVTDHVRAGSSAGMLHLVDRIVRSGYDLQEFLVGLTEHLRNLLVARTTDDTALIEADEATRRRYAERAPVFSEPDLLRLLMIVDEAEDSIKSSTQPRMKLEMALLKMATLAHTTDLREALAQLDRLEALARDGSLADLPAPPAPSPRAARPAPAPPTPVTPAPVSAPPPEAQRDPADVPDEEPAPAPEHVAETTPPSDPTDEEAAAPEPAHPNRTDDDGDPDDRGGHTPTYATLFSTPLLKQPPPRPAAPATDDDPQALRGSSETLQAIMQVAAPPSAGLDRVLSFWPRYVATVKNERIHVGALLQHTTPVDSAGEGIVIGVPDDFHRRLLHSQHDFLLKHLAALSPEPIRQLTFTVQEQLETPAADSTVQDVDPHAYMQRKRRENPVIQAIFDQFGGEMVW